MSLISTGSISLGSTFSVTNSDVKKGIFRSESIGNQWELSVEEWGQQFGVHCPPPPPLQISCGSVCCTNYLLGTNSPPTQPLHSPPFLHQSTHTILSPEYAYILTPKYSQHSYIRVRTHSYTKVLTTFLHQRTHNILTPKYSHILTPK